MKEKLLEWLADRIKEEEFTAEECIQEISDQEKADEHLARMAAFEEVTRHVEENY